MPDQPAPVFTPEQMQMIQALQAQQQQPFVPYPADTRQVQAQPAAQPATEEPEAPKPPDPNIPASVTGEPPISIRKGQPIQAQQSAIPQFRMPATINPVAMSAIQQMMPRPNPELVAAQMRMLNAIKPPSATAKPILGVPLAPSTTRTF